MIFIRRKFCVNSNSYYPKDYLVNRFQLNNNPFPLLTPFTNTFIRQYSTEHGKEPQSFTSQIDQKVRQNISKVSSHTFAPHKKPKLLVSGTVITYSPSKKITSVHVPPKKEKEAFYVYPTPPPKDKKDYYAPRRSHHLDSFFSDYDTFSVKYHSHAYLKVRPRLRGFNPKYASNQEISTMIDLFGSDTSTLFSILGNRSLEEGSDDLYGCVIVKLSRACKDIERAESFFEEVVQQAPNIVGVVMFQSIIQTEVSQAREYKIANRMELAEDYLTRMEREFLIPPNLEVYTMMAAGYAELGMSEEVDGIVVERMPPRNLHPTEKFLFVIFKAYANTFNYEKMEEIVNYMGKPNISVLEIYMGILLNQGKVDPAISIFQNDLHKYHLMPSLTTYKVLIEGLVKVASGYAAQYRVSQNKLDEAMANHMMSIAYKFFKDMDVRRIEILNPVITAMVSGYIATNQYAKIEEMINLMESRGHYPSERSSNTFIMHLLPIRHLLPSGPSLIVKLYKLLKKHPKFYIYYSVFQINAMLHCFMEDDNLEVVLTILRDLQDWEMTRVLKKEMKDV
eukprot:TRINITY_DN3771_c0_g1_i1.p1 TRINITY_DN3771_c0_g1~~TRINITY_DN3771_c0_g1_i1.p1  ORF type:complete len:564 (+),score=88.75 TRINITY_DN3771_c0_g1_i1:211-1902(+)